MTLQRTQLLTSILLLATIATLSGTGVLAQEAAPSMAPVAAPAPAEVTGVTILPRTFLRGYDPLTVFLPGTPGPAAAGPEDQPGRFLTLEPAVGGEYRWLDRSTLIFRPADPWPPLERFRVKAGGADRTLVTLMIPPAALEPADGSTELDPIEEVSLTFREPLSSENLKRMVSFELRPLPGVGGSDMQLLGPDDFGIKVMERGAAKDPARYVFQFKKRIDHGVAVTTRVRLSLDDTSPEAMASYTFATKEPFRILAAGCLPDDSGDEGYEEDDGPPSVSSRTLARSRGMLPLTMAGTSYTREQAVDGGNGAARIALLFSADLAPLTLTDVKALVQFSPAIPELEFSQNGAALWITGKIARHNVYKARIEPALIRDKSGRMLRVEGPSEIFFHFGGRSPYLRWSQSEGILERYGPQMFPMAARRDDRVDLRIHPIDPLDQDFWPFPSDPVQVDESERPPGPGEEPVRAAERSDDLTAEELAVRLKLLGSPPVSTLASLPVRREGGATQFGLPLKDHLTAISGPDRPGTYLVGVRRLNDETTRSYARIQVTDLCLSTVEEERAVVFHVTSIKTGRPVPGATLLLQGVPGGQRINELKTFVTGTTDELGLFRHPHARKLPGELKRLIVRKEDDVLVLLPSDPPPVFADDHWHGPGQGWLDWLDEDPIAPPTISNLLMAHLLTERPVYRPEEEVHIKGYLRVRDEGKLKLAPEGKYEVAVTGPGDRQWRYPVTVTPEGSFYHRFQEKELPTGDYSAVLRDVATQITYGYVDWKAEAYRIPRFEVELHAPDRAPMDRPFTVTATARYYAGGRVVGQPTSWRVTQYPYIHVPPGMKGFYFSSDERYSRSGRFTSGGALERTDVTDGTGASKITVDPSIELDVRPRRYIFEATVTGTDEQTVTNTRQVLALPPFVLGLEVERFHKEGGKVAARIVAIDHADKLLAGQAVTVRLLHRQWHSTLTETDFSSGKARYLTDVVDQEIFTTQVITAGEPVALDLPAGAAGIYLVELSARDQVGRAQVVTVDLFKGGPEALAWKKPEANIFETVADKSKYVEGDTAQILLKSPYQTARALCVIEAPGGNIYQEVGIEGGKALFPVPIRNEYNPRVPVHFLLMRGRIAGGQAAGADLGKPGTMAATTWLKVEPRENRLEMVVEHPEKALPGQEISVTLKLTSPAGKPLPGEVTLWLVDAAVLSLGREKDLDPVPSFIREVSSRIALRDTRNRIIGEVITEENPSGGGTEEPGLLGRLTPRKEFKTVPYYNPRIMIDASGVGTVTFKLSDDLTDFKVRAVASSGPDRFGFAKSTLAVRLPVIVQPVLPRFVRAGDTIKAGAIGRLVEGEGGAGRYEIQAEGAVLLGALTGPIDWVPDRPEKLYFPMKVLAPPVAQGSNPDPRLRLTVAVQRDADQARDAFQVDLPILPDREPTRVRGLRPLERGKSTILAEIGTAVREGTMHQEVLITDEPALLRMVSALDYLYQYRHECTEQRVSQSFPIVALRPMLEAFHLEPNKQKADEILAATFEYLATTLQPSGLYSFWPGGAGYVSLTAYVVPFLVEAKKAGRTFPPALLEKPVAALKQALRSDYTGFISGASLMERCEALQALGVAGAFDPAYGTELAQRAGYLDVYSESQVLLAFDAAQQGSDPLLPALRTDLWSSVVFKLREGAEVYGGLQSRIPEWGGLVLASETKTLAGVIRALHPVEKGNPKLKLMVDELLTSAGDDGWGSTNANAAALLALRDVLQDRKDRLPATFTLTAGGTPRTLSLDRESPTTHFVTEVTDTLQVTWDGGTAAGPFVARFDASFVPVAPGEMVEAKSYGFVVRREVVRVPKDDAPPSRSWIEKEGGSLTFTQGDVVEEHIQVINREDRHFVAVVAPFAAGMEPLNPRLATAPPEATPSSGPTLEPAYSLYLDHEVRFYYESLPAGTYDFHFRTRATTEGSYVHPPARAEMMYRPEVRGNTPGVRYVVQDRQER